MIKISFLQSATIFVFSGMAALGYAMSRLILETWQISNGDFTDYQLSLLLYIVFLSFAYVLFLKIFDIKYLKDAINYAFKQGVYQKWYHVYAFGFINIVVFILGTNWIFFVSSDAWVHADRATVLIGAAFLLKFFFSLHLNKQDGNGVRPA